MRVTRALRTALATDGVVPLRGAFPPAVCEEVRRVFWGRFRAMCQKLERFEPAVLAELADDELFWEFSTRWTGRFEIRFDPATLPPAFARSPAVTEFVKGLHPDFRLVACGAVVALPETDPDAVHQPWHRDCDQDVVSTGGDGSAPSAVTLFVALSDVHPGNGTPQFVPGSHAVAMEDRRDAAVHFELATGDAAMFDNSTVHRGGINRSDRPRLIGLLCFCRDGDVEPDWVGRESLFWTDGYGVPADDAAVRYPDVCCTANEHP